jgi:hypothetical protein
MAKRFTNTDKWKKQWFKKLNTKQKLFWLYILDDCNHAGIWDIDLEVASIRIGDEMSLDEMSFVLGDDVVFIDNREKVFIPKFIEFQYGELNPNSRPHISVINLLEKYNLMDRKKDEVDKPKKKVLKSNKFEIPNVDDINIYCLERNNEVDANIFFDFYSSKGWLVGKTKMKDWKAAVRTWEKNSNNTKDTGRKITKDLTNFKFD